MDEAAALTPAGEDLNFSFTGGEAFLDLHMLETVLRHGTRLGAVISVVTNGYWATSEARARRIVERVREAGLKRLSSSTSRWHQQYVPIERVRLALQVARQAGMGTLLKIAYSTEDEAQGKVAEWSDFVGADQVQSFPVVPYLREGASLPDSDYPRVPGLPEGTCPAAVVSVREDGSAHTCCNPGGFAPMLRIGDVNRDALNGIVANHHYQPVMLVLHNEGPIHFARAAQAHGEGGRLRDAYADICDLCGHIAADPVLAERARLSAKEYRKQWVGRIVDGLRSGR